MDSGSSKRKATLRPPPAPSASSSSSSSSSTSSTSASAPTPSAGTAKRTRLEVGSGAVFSPEGLQCLRGPAAAGATAAEAAPELGPARLRQRYLAGAPFPHLQLEGLFDAAFLRQVRRDLSAVDFDVQSDDLHDLFRSAPLGSVRPRGSGNSGGGGGDDGGSGGDDNSLVRLRDALHSDEFVAFLSRVTGLRLVGSAAASASPAQESAPADVHATIFRRGGYHACHTGEEPPAASTEGASEEEEGGEAEGTADAAISTAGANRRALAFTLHLVDEEWGPASGGAIDLLTSEPNASSSVCSSSSSSSRDTSVNGDGASAPVPAAASAAAGSSTCCCYRPGEVATSLVPAFNSLVVFPVGPRSFHEVAEVTTMLPRLSVTGYYFHANGSGAATTTLSCGRGHTETQLAAAGSPAGWLPPSVRIRAHGARVPPEVARWINPKYLEAEFLAQAAKQFERDSCVELADFLLPAVYQAVRKGAINYRARALVGPRDLANYHRVTGDDVEEFLQFLVSDAFKTYVAQLSGCQLMEDGPGRCFAEARRFERGQYTLASPVALAARDFAFLDASLFLIAAEDRPSWISSECGYSCYTCEEGEILTVDPCANWFALCLCDPGAVGFVKRLSAAAPDARHDVRAQFAVVSSEDDDGDDDDDDDDDDDEEEEGDPSE